MDEIKDNFDELMAKKAALEVAGAAEPVLSQQEQRAAKATTAEHIMQYFEFDMLREPIRAVAEAYFNLATAIHENLPRNPERSVALRKLLESKDAAIRAIFG